MYRTTFLTVILTLMFCFSLPVYIIHIVLAACYFMTLTNCRIMNTHCLLCFCFFPLFQCFICKRSWKLKRPASAPTENPLPHRKHCSWWTSSVIPLLSVWPFDMSIRCYGRVDRRHSEWCWCVRQEEYSAAALDKKGELVCFLSIKPCKPILVVAKTELWIWKLALCLLLKWSKVCCRIWLICPGWDQSCKTCLKAF